MGKEQLISKVKNFWYYHKWHLLVALFVVATIIVGVRSCQQRPNPDLHILFAKQDNQIPLQATELEGFFGPMVEDVNGDGVSTALVTATTIKTVDGSNTAAMLVQVNSGEAILYVLTDETYKILHENGVLEDLSALSAESEFLDGDRYLLSASGALDDLEYFKNDKTSYYLAMRKVQGTTLQDSSKHQEQARMAKTVLNYLIENE